MPKVPQKIWPQINLKTDGKSGLTYLIIERKVPSTKVASTNCQKKWRQTFVSDMGFFSPRGNIRVTLTVIMQDNGWQEGRLHSFRV